MVLIPTLQKSYNVPKHSTVKAFEYILKEDLKDLEIERVEITINKKRFIDVIVEGKDEKVARNLIVNEYGIRKSISEMEEGEIVTGRIVNIGKVRFGLFVNVGALKGNEIVDALYPLFDMRKQLADEKKIPLMKIAKGYGLTENMLMKYRIVSKAILRKELRVELTEETIEWLKEPFREKKDALIICGATRRMIKQALIKTKHWEDIEEIERIGILEYRIKCKKGTNADGLIPEIGGLLNRAKIGAQMTKRYKEIIET